MILILYGNGIVRIFAGSDVTQEMLTYGHQYFIVVTPFYAFLALLFIYRNTLQGLGDSKVPTYAGVMELVMRVIAAFVLGDLFGFYGLAISSPLAWIGALIRLAYSYRHRKNYLDRHWAYQLDS